MISGLTLSAIKAEGMKQDHKWGEQNHEPSVWLAILTEEVGELAQAILADLFDSGRREKLHDSHHVSMETEAIQVAAVAAHFIECLSRRKLADDPPEYDPYDDAADQAEDHAAAQAELARIEAEEAHDRAGEAHDLLVYGEGGTS